MGEGKDWIILSETWDSFAPVAFSPIGRGHSMVTCGVLRQTPHLYSNRPKWIGSSRDLHQIICSLSVRHCSLAGPAIVDDIREEIPFKWTDGRPQTISSRRKSIHCSRSPQGKIKKQKERLGDLGIGTDADRNSKGSANGSPKSDHTLQKG